jgi:excisionase family DNA binding protein
MKAFCSRFDFREERDDMSSEGAIPRLLTVRELAAATGLPRWRIHEMVAQGKGPRHMRIGRTYRFPESDVLAWIAEETATGQ